MSQHGQVSVFVIGLTLTCFAIAGLATDATRSFIARRSLQNVADAAALAGAGEIDENIYYASGGSKINSGRKEVLARATSWLQERGFAGPMEIAVEQDRVRVTLQSKVPTLFLRLIGVSSIAVRVEADATLVPGSIPGG